MDCLPWHWRSQPLDGRTGSEVFERLFLGDRHAALLESPYPTPTDYPYLSRYSICAGMPRTIDGRKKYWTPSIGNILDFLRTRLQESAIETEFPDLPFVGGWLGWLGYDLAWEIEHLPAKNSDLLPFPVAYWYEPANFAVLDHLKQVLWLASTERDDLDYLEKRLAIAIDCPPTKVSREPIVPIFCTSQAEYEAAVRRAKDYIRAGDIFQANLSLRFQSLTHTSSWSLYRRLQRINPSPFASYWQTPWGHVVSCSPERLVNLQGGIAQTRPIAGTRPRDSDLERERMSIAQLTQNPKELAEHIMLVDLERNDLGRVCDWGSVQVNELMVIERYSHVIHLASNAIGKLKSDCDAVDLIRAIFPGGTITGCPKVRCMEIIEELEPARRNLFYGSCGYCDRRGNLDLNILIRTLLLVPEAVGYSRVWGQVGAGIVADSDPTREWQESLQKARAQLLALAVLEADPPAPGSIPPGVRAK